MAGLAISTPVTINPMMTLLQRDKSWLAFNHRVLLEAANEEVPLLERLRFLAIYSSNLDEFFRVRVAGLHALRDSGPEEGEIIDYDPAEVLDWIRREVDRQQKEFGTYYLKGILPALKEKGIVFLSGNELSTDQAIFVQDLWDREVKHACKSFVLEHDAAAPFLQNRQLYLLVVVETALGAHKLAFVEIPTQSIPRFIKLPSDDQIHHFIYLDDIVRKHLPDLFEGMGVLGSYSVKLTRDAKLHIDEEESGDLLEKIREGVGRRTKGVPSRFLYDPEIPEACLDTVKDRLGLKTENLIPGWTHHNFSDFFSFPNPGIDGLENEPVPALRNPQLDAAGSLFDAIDERDRILHYPYHSYDYVGRFLHEAAEDPHVVSIDITLYRIAGDSGIVQALEKAARNGKKVNAFIEMKARFDEETNLSCATILEKAGAQVHYRLPGLKVHSKLCLIQRSINGSKRRYAYLATGNFNEKTARIYTDHALFTADERITRELRMVCDFVTIGRKPEKLDHLLVGPFNMRERFMELLQDEIINAKAGKKARVTLKLNNLEDPPIIQNLAEAAKAGVEVRLIVRTICRLPMPTDHETELFHATSIVDRFLEHGRVYIFHNGGEEKVFLGSADWMTRNLSRRVEVAFPIYDPEIRDEIRKIIHIQLADNKKARVLDYDLSNHPAKSDNPAIRSQIEIHHFLNTKESMDGTCENL